MNKQNFVNKIQSFQTSKLAYIFVSEVTTTLKIELM